MKSLPEVWKIAENLKRKNQLWGMIRIFINRSRNWIGIVRDAAIFALTIHTFNIALDRVFLFSFLFFAFLVFISFELKTVIPQEYDWVFSRTPFFKNMDLRIKDMDSRIKRIEAKILEGNYNE